MDKNFIEIKSLDKVTGFKIDPYMDIFNLITKESNPNVSVVVANLNGKHSKRVNLKSTKIYYVLEGCLLVVNNGIEEKICRDCLIHVPPNISIELLGINCKFIIVCCPAFKEEDEIFFDEPN